MYYEGPKRQGRFIKATSKILKKVALSEFSFSDIGEAQTLALDNAKRTIVHSQYHDPKEIAASLMSTEKFNTDFTDDDNRRPIIMPTDFTEEWERDRKMRKDRVARMDDDEFEFDFETAQRQALEKQKFDEQKEEQGNSATTHNVEADVTLDNATAIGNSGEDLHAAGLIIKTIAAEDVKTEKDDFIPLAVQSVSKSVEEAEDQAIASYKARVEEAKIDEERVEAVYQEAEAQGYREGFRIGEEKAEVQVKEHTRALFGKVAEIVNELKTLKHAVLENVQENFYEVAQALAEALLHREFTIHPETFQAVVARAVSEAVEGDQFKIRVSPKMFDRLTPIATPEFKDILVKDKTLEEFDFKIDSNLSVVDVSVSKMLRELLEKADLGLFEEKGKAS